MRDLFKSLLLNIHKDDLDNDIENILKHRTNDRFEFEDTKDQYDDSPFNKFRSSGQTAPKPNLFYSQYAAAGFNSDTKLSSLGGLSIWQLTAIMIATIFLIGKHSFYQKNYWLENDYNLFINKALGICLIKKIISCVLRRKLNQLSKNKQLTTSNRSDSVRTSYSIDSCSQLMENNYAVQVKLLPELV